jgi:putative transposase
LIELKNTKIPINSQCELLGLSRSAYYYQEKGESEFNQHLMNLIDKQFTYTPFYGVPKMTAHLIGKGFIVNPKKNPALNA